MEFMQSVELEQKSYADLKIVNNTEHDVAFKVLSPLPYSCKHFYTLRNIHLSSHSEF
jgi:hypothetical protein